MIDLRAFREKASWQLVVFILLYLVAALVFLAVFLPTHCGKRIYWRSERVEMAADNLLRVVSGRSTLETQKMDVQRRLYALGQRIPSQYDLFAVLELITELSTSAGVTLESLEHVPLEANSSSASGVIPLSFILTGDGTVYSLILQLQELLPTLQITELLLVYIGDTN